MTWAIKCLEKFNKDCSYLETNKNNSSTFQQRLLTYEFHIHILQHPFGWDEIIAFKKIKFKKKDKSKFATGFTQPLKMPRMIIKLIVCKCMTNKTISLWRHFSYDQRLQFSFIHIYLCHNQDPSVCWQSDYPRPVSIKHLSGTCRILLYAQSW